jgi:Zn-dependent protease
VRTTLHLGRFFGIEVGLHWSLAIVFAIIVWTLGSQALPEVVPDQATPAYWLAAVVAALLFYASLLSHEMGHALVARRLGISVDGITLWVFGGIARLRSDATSPGAEAKVAIAGPVVSLVLALAFGGATFALDTLSGPPLVEGAVAWLAASNAILLLFNLLPAFPLDGGRILRAWLWRRTGDRYRATARAAWLARIFAFAMIGVGIVMQVLQGGFSGLWLMLLAVFLLAAVSSEKAHVMAMRIPMQVVGVRPPSEAVGSARDEQRVPGGLD